MNLYSVTVRADIEFARQWRTDNTLILCAESKDEAEERATNFFLANGLYVRTPVAGTTPRMVDAVEIPLTAMVENPEKYLNRVPQDSADIQKTIEGVSAAQVKERCDKDPEFKKLLDDYKQS